jgi:hypothetical protein
MHVIKARSTRRTKKTEEAELLARATGRMQAQKLFDLIDESAPDEGVVDVHQIEARFADGSRRIPLSEAAAVCAVVDDVSDTTRRMSAVDVDAAVAMAIDDSSDTTRRMSAIQASELAALITPVAEVPVATEVVVKFRATTVRPALELPLPAPVEIEAELPELYEPPAVAAPVRRSSQAWMIGAVLALAGAAAGLAAVLLA